MFAGKMLALLEGEDGDALEDALQSLEEGGMILSVEDLPRPAITGEAGLRLRRAAELAEEVTPLPKKKPPRKAKA